MNITKFCADEDGRYPYSKPWIGDGWRYATDGYIIVREPTTEPDSDHDRPAMLVTVFGGVTPANLRRYVVPTHSGQGKDTTRPACDGLDEPTTDTCAKVGTCKAEGEHECTNRVPYRVLDDMKFDGRQWPGKYIAMINAELPGAKYTIAQNGSMHFFLGRIEGVLTSLKA